MSTDQGLPVSLWSQLKWMKKLKFTIRQICQSRKQDYCEQAVLKRKIYKEGLAGRKIIQERVGIFSA